MSRRRDNALVINQPACQSESVRKAATVALLLSLPGPMLVILAYLIAGSTVSLELFLVGFYCGLICNFAGLLLGLYRWFHPMGFLAICISCVWWTWAIWGMITWDWNL